jgi:hypothetical protein
VSLLITARWKQNWALLQVGSGLRLITITPRLVTIASLMVTHHQLKIKIFVKVMVLC